MEKIIALAVILMGWLILFGLLLTLAHLRSKRKPLDSSGFRVLKGPRPFDIPRGTCHTPRDRQIPA